MDDVPTTAYKFMVPGLEPRMLARPRLTHLLEGFSALPWTTVIAPTGYGKTTLVADWARNRARVVWYTLDASDDDLEVFNRRLMRALNTIQRSQGGALASTPAELVLDFLGDRDQDITFVFDDVHTVMRDDIWGVIQSLIVVGSSRVHIVAVGRRPPPVDLEQSRLRGGLGEIGVADLIMQDDEARSFLQNGLPDGIDPEDLDSIVATADGWVSGLKMGLLGQRSRRGSLSSGSAEWDWGRPFASLFDRVAGEWSDSFLEFMVSIALPSRICGDLISSFDLDWLASKDADRALKDLSDTGLFLIPMTPPTHWYRFQGLFRHELLQRAPHVLSRETISTIYGRTAEWHLHHGNVSEAISHMLLAGEADRAVELVRTAAPNALALDQWREVAQWLDLIGAKVVAQDVDLLICRAWIAQIEGRHEVARGVVEKARTALRLLPSEDNDISRQRYACELDVIEQLTSSPASSGEQRAAVFTRAFSELYGTGTLGEMLTIQHHLVNLSVEDSAKARRISDAIIVENADDADRIAQIRVLWARVAKLFAYGQDGEMHQMLDMCLSIMTLAQSLNVERQIAHAHFLVGSACYELDRLVEAEEHFRAAWRAPEASIRVWVGSAARLARTLDALGRFDEADKLLGECLDRLLERQAIEFISYLRIVELRMHFNRDRPATSLQLVWALDEIDPRSAATEIENPMLARAVVLADSDQLEHEAVANRLLDKLLEHPEWLHWLTSRLQLMMLEAYRHYRHQRHMDASRCLEDAISAAEHGNYKRALLDLGPGIEAMVIWFQEEHPTWPYLGDLVQRLRSHRERMDQSQSSPQTLAPMPPVTGDSAIAALLSHRELEVLNCLCQRFTDKEIAELLCISPTTVKTHTRNIYRKLDVNSRRQVMAKVSASSRLVSGDLSNLG